MDYKPRYYSKNRLAVVFQLYCITGYIVPK